MADLSKLLGSILASVAHARRIADEETAAIAEYYRANPLLEGMSLPRVRIPEMVIDLPMLIQTSEEGEPNVLQDDAVVKEAVTQELLKAAKQEGFEISQTFKNRFNEQLKLELAKVKADGGERGYPREMVVRAVDTAFSRSITEERHERVTPLQTRRIAELVRQRANEVALKKVGTPPRISASIITDEIKQQANSGVVTMLKIVLKEEGLEWSVGENADGTRSRKLTPE